MGNGKSERIVFLSVLRVFAIYWVVLVQHNFAPFHPAWTWVGDGRYYDCFESFGVYTKYVTSITMPLCFFISGYVLFASRILERKTFADFLLNKTLRILLPCYLFGILFQLIVDGGILSVEFLKGYRHMWYLFYLYAMFVTSYFLYKKANGKKALIVFSVIVTIYLLSFAIPSNTLHDFLSYYVYFALGTIASIYLCKIRMVKYHIICVSCIVICFYDDVKWISGLGGVYNIMVIMSLCAILGGYKMKALEHNKIFKLADSTSYGVYIFHMIIQYCVYKTIMSSDCGIFLVSNCLWMSSTISILMIPLSISAILLLRRINL